MVELPSLERNKCITPSGPLKVSVEALPLASTVVSVDRPCSEQTNNASCVLFIPIIVLDIRQKEEYVELQNIDFVGHFVCAYLFRDLGFGRNA
jgi:hypothetical protein